MIDFNKLAQEVTAQISQLRDYRRMIKCFMEDNFDEHCCAFNRYQFFFNKLWESWHILLVTRIFCLTDDSNPDAISIGKLIKQSYMEISNVDSVRYRQLKRNYQSILSTPAYKTLREYRNNYVAHNHFNKPDLDPKSRAWRDLFGLIDNLVNINNEAAQLGVCNALSNWSDPLIIRPPLLKDELLTENINGLLGALEHSAHSDESHKIYLIESQSKKK